MVDKPTLLILQKPPCWIYDHPQGSVVVYGERLVGGERHETKELTLGTANFLLDMAKQALLK